MKGFLLFTLGGAMLIITKSESIQDPALVKRLAVLGKYIVHEVPIQSLRDGYSPHIEHLANDPAQPEEYKILDLDTTRIFMNLNFQTLGPTAYYEPEQGIRFSGNS